MKRSVEEDRIRQEEFRAICVDNKTEMLISERLNTASEADGVWLELKEIFDQIPTCSDIQRNQFDLINGVEKEYEYEMALRLLMGKHGLVPFLESSISSLTWNIYLPPQATAEDRKRRKQFKHMMLWLEKEMQRHGKPVRLIIQTLTDDWRENMPYTTEEYRDPTNDGNLLDNIYCYTWDLIT